MEKTILIKNGRLVDARMDTTGDILVRDGKIAKIAPEIKEQADTMIDASGLAVLPGLVDMHVHLRDPGYQYKEDILSGCEAAAAGGVTSVACMPNTSPVNDNPEVIDYILLRARHAKARVYPVASITKRMEGEELNNFSRLKQAGAVGVSDDGRPVESRSIMKEALCRAQAAGLLPISHCEDLSIINGGIINQGKISEQLGVKGMDRLSEDSITQREIDLARETGCPVHIAHVSTAGAVEAVRQAKATGVKVTCETCPHYFMLTEKELLKRDADYRMNPPLREETDRIAVEQGVLDGTIDCIVTDHAPHSAGEKANFETAPNGVVGLETSLAATLTALYHTGKLSLQDIVRLMSKAPAKLLKIEGGVLKEGAAADLALVDLDELWTVEPEKLHSKSKNTVFKGKSLRGKVKITLLDGNIVYSDNE